MIIKKENKYAPHQVILKRVNKKQNLSVNCVTVINVNLINNMK